MAVGLEAPPSGWRYRMGQALAARRARVGEPERAKAMAELPLALQGIFLAMAPRDQAHALRVLDRLTGESPRLRQAALLHDAGKAIAPLGTAGRTLVVLAAATGTAALLEALPRLGPRVRRYRQHPAYSAELLRGAGADPVLVEIVAEHESRTPVHPETLQLQAADSRE